ncbi:hypothetical protein ACFLYQ_01745 [Chloroflexota bacterium]
MKLYCSTVKSGVATVFLLLLSLFLSACILVGCDFNTYEPERGIRIQNNTNEVLEIFLDGEFNVDDEVYLGRVSPQDEVFWVTEALFLYDKVTAKDMDGNIVYVVTWTRDDTAGKETYDVYLPSEENEPEKTGDNVTISDNITGK